MRAFVMCDGEEAQIRVFQEPEIKLLLEENLIDFGKTPASCSGITQSSDVSFFFKATKASLKNIHTKNYQDPSLERNLKTAFLHFRTGNGPTTITSFTAAKETKLVDALQQICYTIHETIKPSIIENGYIWCGQNAPISLDANGNETMAKYEACMAKCTTQLSVEQCENLRSNFPYFVEIMRTRGRITEAEMDAKGIPSFAEFDSNRTPKDQRALHKQRAVIMNSEECIAQYQAYQQRKLNRITQIEGNRANVEQNRAAVAARKEAVAAEKRRRAGLTDDEKREEANAKRRATIARNRLQREELANQLQVNDEILQQINDQQPEAENGDVNDVLDEELSFRYSRSNSTVSSNYDNSDSELEDFI